MTARLAPDRPMRHVWILAGIGIVAGLAGVAIYFLVGRAHLGPAWYPISIAVEALPCVWIRRPGLASPASEVGDELAGASPFT